MVCYRISVRLEQLAKRLPASLEGSKTLRRFDTDHSCPPFVLSFSCASIYKWFHFHGLVEISPVFPTDIDIAKNNGGKDAYKPKWRILLLSFAVAKNKE